MAWPRFERPSHSSLFLLECFWTSKIEARILEVDLAAPNWDNQYWWFRVFILRERNWFGFDEDSRKWRSFYLNPRIATKIYCFQRRWFSSLSLIDGTCLKEIEVNSDSSPIKDGRVDPLSFDTMLEKKNLYLELKWRHEATGI